MTKEHLDSLKEKNLEIDMQELYVDLKTHLDIAGNNRVFFSGKYGTGKTTFLNSFFKHHEDVFDVYHLYPINYQIKSNDDVVDLLKYDVLVELLKKYPHSFKETEVSGLQDNLLLVREFIKNNFTVNRTLQKTLGYMEDYFGTVESILPVKVSQLGRPLQDLLKLDKQFQEFKKQYKKGDFAKVESFQDSVESHEPDGLSYIISKKIKEVRGNKQSVLVLDDLDRMDPEHIFRILNVFSAFHEQEGGNKFGFDRVIVVGDIDNIRHIFEHFYGPETDFEGYMDKFYSHRWYEFQTREIINFSIIKLIERLGTDAGGQVLQGFQSRDYFIRGVLQHLLHEATYSDYAPSLRQLVKLDKFPSIIRQECDYREKSSERTREEEIQKAMFFVLKVMKQILQTDKALVRLLQSIKNVDQKDKVGEGFYISYSLPLLFKVTKIEPRKGPLQWNEYYINVNEDRSGFDWDTSSQKKDFRALFFDLLAEVVDKKLYE